MKTLFFLAILGFFTYLSNPDTSDFVEHLQYESKEVIKEVGVNESIGSYITDKIFSAIKGPIAEAVIRKDYVFFSVYKIDIPFTDDDIVYLGVFNSFIRLEPTNTGN